MCSSDSKCSNSSKNFKKELVIYLSSSMKNSKTEENISKLCNELISEGYNFDKYIKYTNDNDNESVQVYLCKSQNKKVKIFASNSRSENISDKDMNEIKKEIISNLKKK